MVAGWCVDCVMHVAPRASITRVLIVCQASTRALAQVALISLKNINNLQLAAGYPSRKWHHHRLGSTSAPTMSIDKYYLQISRQSDVPWYLSATNMRYVIPQKIISNGRARNCVLNISYQMNKRSIADGYKVTLVGKWNHNAHWGRVFYHQVAGACIALSGIFRLLPGLCRKYLQGE